LPQNSQKTLDIKLVLWHNSIRGSDTEPLKKEKDRKMGKDRMPIYWKVTGKIETNDVQFCIIPLVVYAETFHEAKREALCALKTSRMRDVTVRYSDLRATRA
jgi:hypothetical protein